MNRTRRHGCFEVCESRRLLTSWYVAEHGNDAAAGTSLAPWATLQHAANKVHAGDTVHVAAGRYGGFDLSTDGQATKPIVFVAESGVLIDRPNARTPDGINLEGADYVTIEGFEVAGLPRAGIRSVTNAYVQILNNNAHDNGRWGIFTGFSAHLRVEGNQASRSQAEHGIYLSNSGDDPLVRGNQIWGNYGNGIHMNGDASQGGDGIISRALIENNVIYDNGKGGGSGINLDGVQDSVVQNNLLYNNHASGISLYQIDGGGASRRNRVEYNTVVQASDGRWALNIQDGSTQNTVRLNVLLTNHSFRGSMDVSADSLPGLTSDYNVVSDRFTTNGGDSRLTLTQWKNNTGQDAHSRVASIDQTFINAALNDYHLRAASAAIGIGPVVTEPSWDLEGDARQLGSPADAGALAWSQQRSGDFDANGVLDDKDIDQLFAVIRQHSTSSQYDLNHDGQVNATDVDQWLGLRNTMVGDANLDGRFDSDDLIAAFQLGQYEDATPMNSGWAGGDWDGNGDFTSDDLIAAFQQGTYVA